MNNVRTQFSIKDLENLSGIKAHTIRIWEKRYELLIPSRTETNIRYYDIANLQHLLNVTLLYNNGVKISKISKLSKTDIKRQCREIISEKANKSLFINDLKVAMLNFDQVLFEQAYQKVINVLDFREVFVSYLIPFLNEIGFLWHTETINLAHEHFITSLIKQKLMIQTEQVQGESPLHPNRRFILFLPDNEIHELGLGYANYEILKGGYAAIFLGQSVPLNSLEAFLNFEEQVIFVTYLTVEPAIDKIPEYLAEIQSTLLENSNNELWVLGNKITELPDLQANEQIKFYSLENFLTALAPTQSIKV